MIELNLLPDVKKEFIKAQRTRNTVITGAIFTTIVAGGLVVLLALTVYGGQAAYIALKTNDIKKAQQELSDIPEIDKYLTVQNQLSNIDSLHSEKYIYSRLFGYLQQINPNAPNNVALTRLEATKADNTIVIEGTARNFEAVNVFQETMKQAQLKYTADGTESTVSLFDEVTLTGTSLVSLENQTLTNFEFSLTLPSTAFTATSSNISVSVPTLTTSDADRNAPKAVFGASPEGN